MAVWARDAEKNTLPNEYRLPMAADIVLARSPVFALRFQTISRLSHRSGARARCRVASPQWHSRVCTHRLEPLQKLLLHPASHGRIDWRFLSPQSFAEN